MRRNLSSLFAYSLIGCVGLVLPLTARAAPKAPTNLVASVVSTNQIDLSWTDTANNEDGFKIERALDNAGIPGAWTQIATTGVNATTYNDTTVSADTKYWYRVRAYNNSGDSANSNQASALTPPLPPSNLTATTVSSNQVNLAWTDNSVTETGFKIERAPDSSGSPGAWAQIGTVSSNVTAYSDIGLTPNTKYWYRLRAYNAGGNSAYGNQATATTLPLPPAAPSGLTATAVATNQINLAWTDNSNNEDGFKIERAPDNAGVPGLWAQIATVLSNVTVNSDGGLSPAVTYWYRVRSYNAGGDSAYAIQTNATTIGIGVLGVIPSSGFTSSGFIGGPFSPASKLYMLTNSGNGSLSWSANNSESWLDVSPSSGTLAVGTSTSVAVSINSNANSLGVGNYSDTVTFTNLMTVYGSTSHNVSLTVNGIAALTVTPSTDFAPGGYIGGPFSPASQVYMVTNSGSASLSWSATNTQNWLSLSATSGVLAVGDSTTVTASVNPNANSLTFGNYSDSIAFSNLTTNLGSTNRGVSLMIKSTNVWTVTSTADSGTGTLRTALAGVSSNDIINFALPQPATIGLSSGELLVTNSVTIAGPGAALVSINGNASSRIFHVGPSTVVSISGLTVTHGVRGIFNDHATLTMSNCVISGNSVNADFGGGIYNAGDSLNPAILTIVNSAITGNGSGYSNGSGGWGGGIANFGNSTVTATGCTIIGNSAGILGGGAYNAAGCTMIIANSLVANNTAPCGGCVGGGFDTDGTLTVSDSTIHGNSTGYAAGAIGIASNGRLTIIRSTITGNSGEGGVGGVGGGVATVQGSIIAGNSNFEGASDVSGTFTSGGYNLIGTTNRTTYAVGGTGFGATDVIGLPPMLGPLQDNGGLTKTCALLPGSPAINAGDPTFFGPPAFDQRGGSFPRVVGGRVDIGAYEATNSAGGGVLAVIPGSALVSTGFVGGPFSPASQVYMVTNSGDASLTWAASNGQNWLSLSALGGALPVGSGTGVTVSINANANNLAGGSYSDSVIFTNLTNGNGTASRSVTLIVAGPPLSPSNLVATAVSSNQINLSWTDNSANEDGFKIERAPDIGGTPGSWAQIATVSTNVTSYNNTGLSPNTTYWYRVRSFNAIGDSDYSNLANATTLGGPDNRWISLASGKWETGTNWSKGIPPAIDQNIFITNANTKAVTINATTSGSFPASMMISNLTISAPNPATNTLSLTGAGGTFTVKKNIVVGHGGVLWLTNSVAAMAATSYPDVQGTANIDGRLDLNGGSLTLNGTVVGSAAGESGTITLSGTSVTIPSYPVGGYLILGNATGSTGTVSVAGTLTVNGSFTVGHGGVGNVTMTSGALSCGLTVGDASGQGTVSFFGGAASLSGFSVGSFGSGTLWVSGGNHFIVAGEPKIGEYAVGEMILSNGVMQFTSDLIVGYYTNGTLRVVGGTLNSGLRLGYNGGMGQVWMTGGQIFATNTGSSLSIQKRGQVTVSNGVIIANTASIGTGFQSSGGFIVAGGTSTIYSNILAGDCANSSTGTVVIAGGRLLVTNSSGSATIDIRSGALIVNSGTLLVDRLVITNACAQFIRTGGTLIYGSATLTTNLDTDGDGMANGWEQAYGLDPLNSADASADNDGDGQSNLQEYLAGTDPTNSASYFHIISVVRTGNDIAVTWMTGPGKTNALQRTAGDASGNYQTNGFADLFIVTNTVGSATNYLDVGGATNTPARYYRVRLVP